MSSLPTSEKTVRFFGLDAGALWRDLLTAWSGMMNWPVVSWLWPKLEVRLWLPSGAQALSRNINAPPLQNHKRIRSARFDAVLLPETLLLRRTLNLPRLQAQELMAALLLEVHHLSPFAPADVIRAYEIAPQEGNALHVSVVLASRKLIDQHIATAHPQLASLAPEVWAPRASGTGSVLLPGFGEARRHRRSTAWRWVSAFMVLLTLALITAMATTPTLQLYLRTLQANQAMTALQQKAVPALAQRESLVRGSDQLTSLAAITGEPVAPLQTLKLITDTLPDDTSLLSLQIQGLKVNISGQTVNASTLMKQLGSTPGMRDVKAPTPATKPLGAPRETFTIEFMLDPAQLRAAP
jgi:general secretion pathway protein L